VTANVLQSHTAGLRQGQSLSLAVHPESVILLPGKFAVASAT
jgi:hypothetical protein